ncbi:MAG: ATP-binding protein [Anaerolineaceae bacterium]|nr:ATP-binding protein [Anaerolineaceae bacterium]
MLPSYRIRQRDYLLEILRALTEELNLEALLTRILSLSIDMLSGQAGFISLIDEDETWEIQVAQGIPGALVSRLNLWAKNLTQSDKAPNLLPEMNRFLKDVSMGAMNGISLPLTVHGKSIGEIYVLRSTQVIFNADDLSILGSFANQAAIAVRNARLYNQSIEHSLRLAALINAVVEGILILDTDFKVSKVNTSLERMLNRQQSELLDKPYAEVIQWIRQPHGTSIEDSVRTYWVKYSREELLLEGEIQRGGGLKALPVSMYYAPLFDEKGRLINIIASLQDITRFREAEELKENFISVVSHELKTPIALIKGYASTLRRDDVTWDKETIQESLGVIEDEADHLTLMVEDLLDASRLQASGGILLKKSELDLAELAAEVVKRFRKQDYPQTFKLEFPLDFPLVVGDEPRLRQVLTNLVGNAVKYTQTGEITIQGVYNTREVEVSVRDQGKGFDPVDIPHIFERFYRSEEAIKSTKGTGLGLYLCKAIVNAHGGRIWVDESYHTGASIHFAIPREDQKIPLLRLQNDSSA